MIKQKRGMSQAKAWLLILNVVLAIVAFSYLISALKFDPSKEYYLVTPKDDIRGVPYYYIEKGASVPLGYNVEESFGVKGAMSGEWLNKNSSTDLAVDPADYNIYTSKQNKTNR